MEEKLIRHIIYSDEFEEYYASMNEQLKKKYDYALQIVKSQYVVSSKIVKSLENTDFYELRISISSNEYRTILLALTTTISYKAKMYFFWTRSWRKIQNSTRLK